MAINRRKTQLYIVDGSLTMRAMLATLAGRERDYEICGVAASARQALDEISYALPHIVLLDPDHSGMDGLEFLKAIRNHWQPMCVVIVSMSAKPGSMACSAAFNWGAVACFDKSKLVHNWREFFGLLDEIRAETGVISVIEPSGVTLPALLDYDEAA